MSGDDVGSGVLAERIQSLDRLVQQRIEGLQRSVDRVEANLRWAWRTIGATLVATVGGLLLEVLSRGAAG